MRKYLASATLCALIACSQDGSAGLQQVKKESCGAVEKERAAFRKSMKSKADKLSAELGIDKSNLKVEAYPELKDAPKLLEFQTEFEGRENMFTVRLSECSKG